MSCCEDDPPDPKCHQGESRQENVVGVLMALAACICAVALIILFWRS